MNYAAFVRSWRRVSRRQGWGSRRQQIMIEQNATPRRRAMRESDKHLDEARLRQQAIGVKLRQIFDSVVAEDVPDEFLEILRRADANKAAAAADGAAISKDPPSSHQEPEE